MGRASAHPADASANFEHWSAELSRETSAHDVRADMRTGGVDFQLVDTRSEGDFVAGHLPGAIHLPPHAIDSATAKHFLQPNRLVICYGVDASDLEVKRAAQKLSQLAFPVKIMLGGMTKWRILQFPVDGVA